MTKSKTDYIPVDCSFYDYLEQDATLGKVSDIQYLNIENVACQVNGIIEDLYIRDKAEYLRLTSGTEIRLDQILSFNGHQPQNFCSF